MKALQFFEMLGSTHSDNISQKTCMFSNCLESQIVHSFRCG